MVSVVCIYSKDGLIGRIAEDFLSQGAELHLWALDGIAPSASRWTHGVGPGDKMTNLNRLFPYFRDSERVLFTDDDIEFPPNFLNNFLSAVDEFGLELAQPALSHESAHTFPHTLVRPDLLVRETNWVEQMVFTMSREMIQQVMPIPEDFWMGWGMEMIWEKVARENGWKTGIIDRTPVHHRTRAISSRYDAKKASTSMLTALERSGLSWVPMRTLCAFSDGRECSWVPASTARFITTLSKIAAAAKPLDNSKNASTDGSIVETIPPPLRDYWRMAHLVYKEVYSAFSDDAEIAALFEDEGKAEERKRFLIDFFSIVSEHRAEDAILRAWLSSRVGLAEI